MKKSANSVIEKIKSVALVVLFLWTILLLYFYWEDLRFENLSLDGLHLPFENGSEQRLQVTDIVIPGHIDVCIGNDTFTKLESEKIACWDSGSVSILSLFRQVLSSEDTYIEEISKQQYEEIMKYESVRAVFDYTLPLREYCEVLEVRVPPTVEGLKNLSEIGFSAGSSESTFLYDRSTNRYYRIVSDVSADELLKKTAEMAASENLTYYPISSLVGQELSARVLVPAILTADLTEESVRLADEEDPVPEIAARSFFTDTFDFVRKIEEQSGKTIYMYGYGERTLIVDTDGSIEYKADAPERSTDRYFTALERVLAKLSEQKLLFGEGSAELSLRLTYAEALAGGGYRFEFGVTVDGENLYLEDGRLIEAEVSGDQITYFKCRKLVFDNGTRGEMAEAMSPINVVAENYEILYALMSGTRAEKSVPERETEEHFDAVVQAISDMDYGYVLPRGETILRPCYTVFLNAGNLEVYFDLYTAEYLGANLLYESRTKE